jgi:hypothetical protein
MLGPAAASVVMVSLAVVSAAVTVDAGSIAKLTSTLRDAPATVPALGAIVLFVV